MSPMPVTPVTEYRPVEWFKPDERELARHDDPENIRQAGQDMLVNGQHQPVGAIEDGRMIFGHGRLLAAKAAGIKTLEVKIYPASLTTTQFKLIRAGENLQRKDLTGYRKWLLCADLMRDNPTWQMKELAEALHLDPSMVTRLLSPGKCIAAASKEMKRARDLGYTAKTFASAMRDKAKAANAS
jgi:ParB family transcriptional regulator, chromosome partitioning protein